MRQRRVLNGLLNAEIAGQLAVFDAAIRGLDARSFRWAEPEMFVVADTTFYMQHEKLFDEVAFDDLLGDRTEYNDGKQNIRLLIPLVVVDELDAQKRRSEIEKRKRARQVLAVLDRLFSNPDAPATLTPRAAGGGAKSITVELLFDPPNHVRLARADDEIIERMVAEQPIAQRRFTLITFDTGMTTRARKAGLASLKLNEPDVPEKAQTSNKGRRDQAPRGGQEHARQRGQLGTEDLQSSLDRKG